MTALARIRPWLGATTIVAILAVAVAFALAADGRLASAAASNDGGAWFANRPTGSVAHVELSTREPTSSSQLADPGADLRVRQTADAVVVHDESTTTVYLIDEATAFSAAETTVPGGAVVQTGGGQIVVHDGLSGDLWIATALEFGEVDNVTELDATDSDVVAFAAGPSGVVVYLDNDGVIHRNDQTLGVTLLEQSANRGESVKLTVAGDLAIVGVGDEWFAVSRDGSRQVKSQLDAVSVQAPGVDQHQIALETADGALALLSIASGEVSVLGTSGLAETQPIRWHNGCIWELGQTPTQQLRLDRHCLDPDDSHQDDLSIEHAGADLRVVNDHVIVDHHEGGGTVVSPDLETTSFTLGADDASLQEETGDETDDIQDPGDPNAGTGDTDLNLTEENTSPRAADDEYGMRLPRSRVIRPLDNDADDDGDVLVISDIAVISGEVEAILSPNRDSIQLIADTTPGEADGAAGARTARLTYAISDGRGGTDSAEITLTIAPDTAEGNRAPAPFVDRLSGAAGAVVTANLLDNDTDPDGDPLVLVAVDGNDNITVLSQTPDGDIAVAIAEASSDGEQSIAYQVRDTWGAEATGEVRLTFRISGDNSRPQAGNDSAVIGTDQRISLPVLANDADPDADQLFVASPAALFEIDGTRDPVGVAPFTKTTRDGEFVFSAARSGTYIYTYTVSDGAATDVAFIRIEVEDHDENEAPVALSDELVLSAGDQRLLAAFDNDADPDGDVTRVNFVTPNDDLVIETRPGVGFLVTLLPSASTVETFDYQLTDGMDQSRPATVTVARSDQALNDSPPEAFDDSLTVRAGGTSRLAVLTNDFDPEGGEIILTGDVSSSTPDVTAQASDDNRDVVVVVDPDRVLPFALQYSVVDEAGNIAAADVQVLVADPDENTAPTARTDQAQILGSPGQSTNEVVAAVIAVLENDSDPESDALALTGEFPQMPQAGIAELDPSGNTVVYTPFPGFVGTDRFLYEVSDALGERSVGLVEVGVFEPGVQNTPPVAQSDRDFSFASGDGVVMLDVLANDSDLDGDRLEVVRVNGAGAEVANNGSAIAFELPARITETEQQALTYVITDGRGGTDEADVLITVLPSLEPEPPQAVDDDHGPVLGGERVVIPVLINDSDPDSSLTILDGERADLRISDASADVEVSAFDVVNPSTGAAYTEDHIVITAPSSSATYSYTIVDESGLESTATINLIVEPNVAPEVTTPVDLGEFPSDPEEPIVVDLVGYVTDADGDELTFLPPTGRIGGITEVLSGDDASQVMFIPDFSFEGPAGFTYEVTDGRGHRVGGRINLTITGPSNTAPTGVDQLIRIEAGIDLPFSLNTLFSDPDVDDSLVYEITEQPSDPLTLVSETNGEEILLVTPAVAGDASVSFGVRATDLAGEFALSNVTVEVEASTIAPPVTQPDAGETLQGQAVTVNVTSNDIDTFANETARREGRPPTPALALVNAFVDGGSGTATTTADSITFQPNDDFFGSTTIRYQVWDERAVESAAADGVLTINVIGRPDVPTEITAEPVGPRTVNLTWRAPSANGAPIDAYEVQIDGGTGATVVSSGGSQPRFVADGLTPGVTYRFAVRAQNVAGQSRWSALSAPVIPDTEPGQPPKPRAVFAPAGGTLLVDWQQPPNEGSPIQHYLLTISGCAAGNREVQALTFSWTELPNGQRCSFTVSAVNARGPGPASVPSDPECAVAAPGAPNAPSAVRGDGRAEVAWAQPDNPDCEDLAEYEIQRFRDGTVDTTLSTAFGQSTLSDAPLQNGSTYSYVIRARNRAGWGPFSAPSPGVVPCGPPLAPPTAPAATRGDLQVTIAVTSEAPANGCAVEQYQVQDQLGGQPRTLPPTGIIDGLTNGVSYQFQLRGINEEGVGEWSASSAGVVPAGRPFPGVITTAEVGTELEWVATFDRDNGSPITSVIVSGDAGVTAVSGGTGRAQCLNSLGNPCLAASSGQVRFVSRCLQNAETVSATASASNAVGTSEQITDSVQLGGCPGVPSLSVSTDARANSYSLNWTRPAGTKEIFLVTNGEGPQGVGGTSGGGVGANGLVGTTYRVWACNEFGCAPSPQETLALQIFVEPTSELTNPFLCVDDRDANTGPIIARLYGFLPNENVKITWDLSDREHARTDRNDGEDDGSASASGVRTVAWECGNNEFNPGETTFSNDLTATGSISGRVGVVRLIQGQT